MPKKKPLCFFCHRPINQEAVYYIIVTPDGQQALAHGHTGVEENGGVRMLKGKPFPRDNN